jgi:prepilin-type N-terminal cleavage/methylation domain-containing protein
MPAERQHGFSLVEVLAALAITSVIITAIGALVHNVALYFDRGTRAVGENERLILAIERLASDIGAARFISRMSDLGPALAFTGEPADGEQPAKMTFVTAGPVISKHWGEEVVSLSVEQEGDVARLVRRRATWWGPRTRFEAVTFGDPVILLEGKVLMSFAFGRIAPDGGIAWSDAWTGQPALPRLVRLLLRDRASGADLLAGNDFLVRADASGGCAQNDASGCVAAFRANVRAGHDD